jgi:hypothetical protein
MRKKNLKYNWNKLIRGYLEDVQEGNMNIDDVLGALECHIEEELNER